MSKRPRAAVVGDIRIHDDAVVCDNHPISNARVRNPAALINLTTFTEGRFAFDVNVWVNNTIGTDLSLGANVSVRRIDEGHATVHHEAPDRVATQQILEFGQLSSIVNAGDLPRVRV